MMNTIYIFLFIILSVVMFNRTDACNTTIEVPYTISYIDYIPKLYTEIYYESCYLYLFLCEKQRTITKNIPKLKTKTLTKLKTVCCDGYNLENGVTRQCVPECTPACVNSRCVAPNTCRCIKNMNACCPGSCTNGYCTHPVHDCSPGHTEYKSNETDAGGRCRPIPLECAGDDCEKTEMCTCNEGFELSADNPFQCVSSCTKPCVNGFCTGRENCTCLDGYSSNGDDAYVCDKISTEMYNESTLAAYDTEVADIEGSKRINPVATVTLMIFIMSLLIIFAALAFMYKKILFLERKLNSDSMNVMNTLYGTNL